jgi:hypothetical protein
MSDCPHDVLAQPVWVDSESIEIQCMLCTATTVVHIGDLTTSEWEGGDDR